MENKERDCGVDYPPTIKQRKGMYLSQGGCCKLCEKSVLYDKMEADHNHRTGRVRGLLCHRCNRRVGYIERCMKTNPRLQQTCCLPDKTYLQKVLKYLDFKGDLIDITKCWLEARQREEQERKKGW